MPVTFELARRGRLPDRLARLSVRRSLLGRLRSVRRFVSDLPDARFGGLLDQVHNDPWWLPGSHLPLEGVPGMAEQILGSRRLEAAAHWTAGSKDLDAAEAEMLALVLQRAEVADGHEVLVAGGRWAAPAFYLTGEVAAARVLAWTAEQADAERISALAHRAGLTEVEVAAGSFEQAVEPSFFDRILVVEGLPCRTDPRAFLTALGRRLKPDGALFVQLPCHRRYAYELAAAERVWLGLAGSGLVPATDLVPRLATDLLLKRHWELSGEHYERTARAWRGRLESDHSRLLDLLTPTLGETPARHALARWRLALLAREEMFGLRGGQEWWISHYLFGRAKP